MNIVTLLAEATENIQKNYFQLPVDGREDAVYRERVYCYELYHQLRAIWPNETEYELGGEVDKSGHPLIRGNNLDRVKPDLLVHVPGDMGGNHTVIEVKPISANRAGVFKDLTTLTAFRRHAEYRHAIYLFYGGDDISPILSTVNELQHNDRNDVIDLRLMSLWWHNQVGAPANEVQVTT